MVALNKDRRIKLKALENKNKLNEIKIDNL